MKRTWMLGVVATAVLGSSVACGVRERTSDRSEVTVGVVLPQTGSTAFIGEAVRRGIDIASEQLSLRQGAPHIRLIYEDDGGMVERATSAYRKLTAVNHASAVILVSTGARAVAPLAEEDSVPLLCTAVSASRISAGRKWVFRYFINADADAALIGDYAARRKGYRRLAVLYVNDEMGVSYRDAFQRALTTGGSALVSLEPFGFGVTDFRPLLIRIRASRPDALYIVGYSDAIAVIPGQMRDVGLNVPILSVGTISQPEIMRQAGAAVDGAVYTTTAFNTLAPGTPTLRAFVAAFTTKYGSPPIFFEVFGFDSFNLISTAVERVGGDRFAIRSALAGITDIEGAAGHLSVGADGEVSFPIRLRQIRSGRWADVAQ